MLRTPTGGAGNGTASAEARPMSIGTVLIQLREEFPEVTISKIRFLVPRGSSSRSAPLPDTGSSLR
ncbi:hypothetical protein SCALM49S_02606 [Streptomyces californicus]